MRETDGESEKCTVKRRQHEEFKFDHERGSLHHDSVSACVKSERRRKESDEQLIDQLPFSIPP